MIRLLSHFYGERLKRSEGKDIKSLLSVKAIRKVCQYRGRVPLSLMSDESIMWLLVGVGN